MIWLSNITFDYNQRAVCKAPMSSFDNQMISSHATLQTLIKTAQSDYDQK